MLVVYDALTRFTYEPVVGGEAITPQAGVIVAYDASSNQVRVFKEGTDSRVYGVIISVSQDTDPSGNPYCSILVRGTLKAETLRYETTDASGNPIEATGSAFELLNRKFNSPHVLGVEI